MNTIADEKQRQLLQAARAAMQSGCYEAAIQHFTMALKANPQDDRIWYLRGVSYYNVGEKSRAFNDFDSAIQINARESWYYCGRGTTKEAIPDFNGAAMDYGAAIEINKKDKFGYLCLAGLLATCPKSSIRDSARAIDLAQKACELSKWKDWRCLAALAASHAEGGDFEGAIHFGTRALELAPPEEKGERESRIRLYRSGIPYHRQI